ncbi:response regulator [Larkinella soli]|uniref:response regulator n=1 Tax=Larkinella soli TaxID=1770527 RepID=UPI000FFCC5AC|nr:response regulator [Larkinella soli]
MEKNKEILLIDDDPEECELLLLILKSQWPDYELLCLETSQQVWDFLEKAKLLPALILMDVNLQGETSLELLGRMKADPRFKKVPVLVLTGSDNQRYVELFLQAGANAYLHKPAQLKEYKTLLMAIRTQWLEVGSGASLAPHPSEGDGAV